MSGAETIFGINRKLLGKNKRGFLVPIIHMISTGDQLLSSTGIEVIAAVRKIKEMPDQG